MTEEYTEKDYWEGNMTQEEFEENLPKYGYEYTPTSSEDSVVIKVAGAQIPCGINIDSNKKIPTAIKITTGESAHSEPIPSEDLSDRVTVNPLSFPGVDSR